MTRDQWQWQWMRDGWRAVLTGMRDWDDKPVGRIFGLILNPLALPAPITNDMQQMVDDIEHQEEHNGKGR